MPTLPEAVITILSLVLVAAPPAPKMIGPFWATIFMPLVAEDPESITKELGRESKLLFVRADSLNRILPKLLLSEYPPKIINSLPEVVADINWTLAFVDAAKT